MNGVLAETISSRYAFGRKLSALLYPHRGSINCSRIIHRGNM